MKKIVSLFISLFLVTSTVVVSQTVTVTVDAAAGRKAISPYIFGRNNSLSDNPSKPLSASDWQFLRDAGVKMFRENGGNNSTKYNWRRKLSSHPDWYNNVYAHDWDFTAKSLEENIPGASAMFAFQLIGKAASNTSNNFDDWNYNGSNWWSGVNQNLAGGGIVDPNGGSVALQDGDPSLYLMDWPADSTVGILSHWFGANGIGLDTTRLLYWNMDNEPEIWSGTHDDVMPTQLPAEDFMQEYFAVAKKSREKLPNIKLVGPVPANEWQWYNWDNDVISSGGHSYVWLQYFIKRIAEEQQASGTRLLDVLDIHFYPDESNPADIVQLYRVFFDKTYVFPGANGVKRINGGWDNSITKEYIFERCRAWLNNYIGPDNGVTFSVSEMAIPGNDPNVTAVSYASILGTFADNGVELFTPWTWKTGMWETLHLFSKYSKNTRVKSVSTDSLMVSAYSSVNDAEDSITIILVNRSQDQNMNVTVNLSNFGVAGGEYNTLGFHNLPSSETFVSATSNALQPGTVTVDSNTFDIALSPLSVTAVMLPAGEDIPSSVLHNEAASANLKIYPNPVHTDATISYNLQKAGNVRVEVYDIQGREAGVLSDHIEQPGNHTLSFNRKNLEEGTYFIRLETGGQILHKKIIIMK